VLITSDNYMASINEKEEWRRGGREGGGEEMASAGSIDGGTLIRGLKVIKKRIRKIQRSGWSGLQDLEEDKSSVQS
jgi:hypothetical protein